MLLLSCRNIKKDFGLKKVLKGIDFDLARGEKVGLVGQNGAGKTTLAEIIFGNLKSDEGEVIRHGDHIRIGYLLQSTSYTENTFTRMIQSEERELNDFFKITSFLGLERVREWSPERLEKGLSGGERTKLALARIWAAKPDILILDEPTNHLDLQGREWLIEELKKFSGAALIISHDRYFLDQTVNRIFELERGRLKIFNGNYTFYRREKKRIYEARLHAYKEQKKQERKLEEQIRRLDQWANRAHREAPKKAIASGIKKGGKEFLRVKAKKMDSQVKSKKKRLEKLRRKITRPEKEPEIRFEFSGPEKRGRRVIEVKGLTKSYGERVLFKDSNFYILHGDRIGVFGENGCGKTTLLKIILGEERAEEGEVWVSPSLKPAYLSQDVFDLDGEASAMENLIALKGYYNHQARTLLACMGFTTEMLQKPVKKLSLGERTRLKLADLILREYDCLLLDEPTNHLDLYSREQLEDTLSRFQGTLVIVSHDRYLLEKLCRQMLVFEGGTVKRLEMGFKEYYRKIRKEREIKPGSVQVGERGAAQRREEIKEQIMVIETRMAALFGEFDKYSPEDTEYEELDREFQELVRKKRELEQILEV